MPRACLLFKPVSLGWHFPSPLNTWPDRALPCEHEVRASLLLFLRCLPGICPASELARVQNRWHLRDLSQLEDSKPAWKALLPEESWSNSWSKTNKNNYRANLRKCQGQHKHADPGKPCPELGEAGLACLQAGSRGGELWPSCQSWAFPDCPKALLHCPPAS